MSAHPQSWHFAQLHCAVKGLIAKGAAVNVRAKDGTTALIGASQNGYLEVKELPLKAGAR